MNSKRAVIFDMDGVLVDNAAWHLRAWTEFCRRHGVLDKLDHGAMFGKTNRDYLRHFFGNLQEEEMKRLSAEKESVYQSLYGPHMKPVSGLLPFLEGIRNAGLFIALATSGPATNVEFVLSGLGIRDYFSVTVDDSQVTRGKPHPEVYRVTAALLGIPASCCLVMEDSVHGIEAAKAAGMKVVGINTGRDRTRLAGADLVVEDFNGLNLQMLMDLLKM